MSETTAKTSLKLRHQCCTPTGSNSWTIIVPKGTTADQLTDPACWAHISGPRNWTEKDDLRIWAEDGSFYAQAIVLQAGALFAKIKITNWTDLTESDIADVGRGGDLYVEWKGPVRLHSVIRRSDGAIMRDKFANKKDAEDWKNEHAKSMAA